jgi:hypothetical protein
MCPPHLPPGKDVTWIQVPPSTVRMWQA